MKLVKTLSAIAAVAVLAACSNSAKKEQPVVVKSEKTVVYSCGKKLVRVVYQFEGKEAVEAQVSLGKKVIAEGLQRDTAQKDFTSFASDKYTWNVDTGFTLDNTTEVDAVMLTQKGKKSDKILAKHCSINAKATAKANQ